MFKFIRQNWREIAIGVIIVLVSTFVLYLFYRAYPYRKLHVPLWLFIGEIAVSAIILVRIVEKKKIHHAKEMADFDDRKSEEIKELNEANTRAVIKVKADETAMRHKDVTALEQKVTDRDTVIKNLKSIHQEDMASREKTHGDSMVKKHEEFTKLYCGLEKSNEAKINQIAELKNELARYQTMEAAFGARGVERLIQAEQKDPEELLSAKDEEIANLKREYRGAMENSAKEMAQQKAKEAKEIEYLKEKISKLENPEIKPFTGGGLIRSERENEKQ